MRPIHLSLCCAVLLLGACAPFRPGDDRVIIDTRGVDMEQYRDDIKECGTFADQVAVGKRTGKAAGAGAAVGSAVGAIFAGGVGAAKGGSAGAVTGAYRGSTDAKREQLRVVKRCLRGRGYKVLN